jgi:hypothetical protein
MQFLDSLKFSPSPPSIQREWNIQNSKGSPTVPQISIPNVPPSTNRQPSPSINQVPTNLNNTMNTFPQTQLAPSNKLDINLNINVNNDGSISTSTGKVPPAPNHIIKNSPSTTFNHVGNASHYGNSLGIPRLPVRGPFANGQ